MGRPVKGSIKCVSASSWEVSFPKHQGSTDRQYEYFPSFEEAEAWRLVALEAYRSGVSLPPPVSKEHWFVELCNNWHNRVYQFERRAEPGRMKDVRRFLDQKIIPYFSARWATPADVDINDCFQFVHVLAGLRTMSGEATTPDTRPQPTAVRESTQGSFIAVLKEVLNEAVARRMIPVNPALMLRSVEPASWAILRTRSKQTTACTLEFAKEVAGRLHVHNQTVLWTQRIVGLRISEVYGITIEDIIPDGDTGAGWVLIDAQGGGEFLMWNDRGEVEKTKQIDRVKTRQSCRLACIPQALMQLFDLVIDLYHRDADGNVDPSQPLIPGIRKLEADRQAYTTALKQQSLVADDDYLCSHSLRAAMITDLTHWTEVKPEVRRLLVGHLAGGDVHDRVYNGQTLDRTSLRSARDESQRLIEETIGSLLVATTHEVVFARDHAMRRWMDRAREMLIERQLLIGDHIGTSTEEAGERIGRTPQVIRRYLKDGVLTGRKAPSPAGGFQWVVDDESIERFIEHYGDKLTYADFEEELGMTYHQVYQLAKRLDIQPTRDEATRRDLFTHEQRALILDHLARCKRMRERSMSIDAAADSLKRRRSTLQSWIGKRLVIDEEATELLGKLHLTRTSVEAARQEMASSPGRNLPGLR